MKPITAIFVPVDRLDPTELVVVDDYRQIQGYVGGTFDIARGACVAPDGSGDLLPLSVYVNDEGLIFGMETNPRLSFVIGRRLVGPGLIAGGVDEEGNTLSVPAHYQQTIDRRENRMAGLRDMS